MNHFENEEAVLNLLQEVLEFTIDPKMFSQLSCDVKSAFGLYMVRIEREMYGEQLLESVPVEFTFKQPKTWWQHFKQEKFSAWLLRKYPVQYKIQTETKIVELDRRFVFPQAYREGHPILGKFIIRDFYRVP